MFFISDDHKKNFDCCLTKFKCHNREYSSVCYVAALPNIFKCFPLEMQHHGPFDWYFEHLHESSDDRSIQVLGNPSIGDTAPLTSQTKALVHLALNLWNGHQFDLAEGLSIWDSDLYKVALQAIELRRRDLTIII